MAGVGGRGQKGKPRGKLHTHIKHTHTMVAVVLGGIQRLARGVLARGLVVCAGCLRFGVEEA